MSDDEQEYAACGIDDIAPVQRTLTDTDYYIVNLNVTSRNTDADVNALFVTKLDKEIPAQTQTS